MTIDPNLIVRGKHLARLRSIQFGLAGKDDKEQVVARFEFITPDDPDVGRFITAFLFLTDATFDRTIESLRHCGWTGDELAELPALAEAGQLGTDVELVVDHEEYNGEWQAKVKWINKPGGGGAITLKKPLEGDALKRFSAQMKGRVRASVPRTSAKKPVTPNGGATPHPNAPGADEGDIPFASCDVALDPSAIARILR